MAGLAIRARVISWERCRSNGCDAEPLTVDDAARSEALDYWDDEVARFVQPVDRAGRGGATTSELRVEVVDEEGIAWIRLVHPVTEFEVIPAEEG